MSGTRMLVGFVGFILIAMTGISASAQSLSGGVNQLDANTFEIGVAAGFFQGGPVQEVDLPFTLPANRTIASLQGLVTYKNSSCFAEALAVLAIDGKDAYRSITKLPPF